MPHLVRVRGKRRKPGSQGSSPAFDQKKSRKKNVKQQELDPTLSRLEALPTEILQEIFILHPNFALADASPILHQKLDSEHVKMRLVTKYLTNIRDGVVAGLYPANRPGDLLPDAALATPEDMQTHLQDVQTSILAAPWMDYRFMRRCQWYFFLQKATRQLRHFLRDLTREEVEAQVARLRARITVYFNRSERKLSPHDPKDWRGRYAFERSDGSTFTWTPNTLRGDCQTFLIYTTASWDGDDAPTDGTNLTGLHGVEYEKKQVHGFLSYQMPFIDMGTRLPPKYVTGPWTQDRGDLLKLILDGRDIYNPIVHDNTGRLAEDIWDKTDDLLDSVIEDRCFAALELLLPTNQGLPEMPIAADNELVRGYCIKAPETDQDVPFLYPIEEVEDVPQNDSDPNADYSATLLPTSSRRWTVLKGALPRNKPFESNPTIEHLELCIRQAAESGSSLDWAFFTWFAHKSVGYSLRYHAVLAMLSRKFRRDEHGNRRDDVYVRAWRWLSSNEIFAGRRSD
jgi:hypothetical protein